MFTRKTLLNFAFVLFSNLFNNSALLALLAIFGYGADRLAEGKARYDKAQALSTTRVDVHRSKVKGSTGFRQLWARIKLYYHNDVEVARKALKSRPELYASLLLHGKRAVAFSEWLHQAKTFYQGISNDPELQALVAELGLTADRVALALQMLQELESAYVQRYEQKASAKAARRERDEALDALEEWLVTFIYNLRKACVSAPEHLDALGITPLAGTRKKKLAPPVAKPGEAPSEQAVENQ